MLVRFSSRQKFLLGVGIALIVLPMSADLISGRWNGSPKPDTVVWNNLTIVLDGNIRITKMDEATLVARSTGERKSRLTVFLRDQSESSPRELVQDLCTRDSCVYVPLGDVARNGAVADYRSGAPMQIVLMHPGQKGIWLEFKGPPSDFAAFDPLIDSVVAQLHE